MPEQCPHLDVEWLKCDGCRLSDEIHYFAICEDCGATVAENGVG
jgi:hypothetical protein